MAEILGWSAAGNEKRNAILQRCRLRREQRGRGRSDTPDVHH
jgi:predicted Fe-S protein YdhL (DUF1289 family)